MSSDRAPAPPPTAPPAATAGPELPAYLTAAEILDLHRRLVAIPSLSHQEGAITAHAAAFLAARGAAVERIGANVVARRGKGPRRLLLDTHLDTVPPAASWTRDPWQPAVVDGRVYGLGANDAKAAAAAMAAAFLAVPDAGACEVHLLLVVEEETGGAGTELAWPELRRRGLVPDGVVIGEPTALDVAIAQKGLLVLELEARGDACHAANAGAFAGGRGARNAVFGLARDLAALERAELGPPHALLGPTTLQPTIIAGGTARNVVPDRATAILDLRTVPGEEHAALAGRLQATVSGALRVLSGRLEPRECPAEAAIVSAARAARPEACLFGSPTMSDLAFFGGVPAIKCGPGRSERSHTADEYVLEAEVLDGERFYRRLIAAFAGGA